MTAVERVLILKGADLLKGIGPRHLLRLANVTREIDIVQGDRIYEETDPADALYMLVDGRVRLTLEGGGISEVGPREAFGTWSLVDDSERKHRAECIEDGLMLALRRDDFYDVAAGDNTLLQEIIRVLAKRLRDLVVERPEEARVEGEGAEPPEALKEEMEAAQDALPATPGQALESAALGQTATLVESHPSPAELDVPPQDIRVHEEEDPTEGKSDSSDTETVRSGKQTGKSG